MNHRIHKLEIERLQRVLPIIFGIFFFLFAISPVQALTVEELIDSYSFDYNGEEIGSISISDSLISNVLSFDINIASAAVGNYSFYVDLEDVNGVVSGEAVGDLTSSGGDVRVEISTHYLSGISQFNYSLRIYDMEGSLVYKQDDLVTEVDLSYDSGYEVLDIRDYNIDDDYMELNVSVHSSVVAVENVSVFLNYGDDIISVSSEESLGIGINYVILRIGGDVLGASHYDGAYDITGILVGEKFILFNYTSSVYDFEDFIKGSYLKGFNSSFVDLDLNNLTDYLEFDFEIEVREAGEYRVEADVYDMMGKYLASISESENLSAGVGNIAARVDGGLLYSLGADGPYLISVARLFRDNVEIDLVRSAYGHDSGEPDVYVTEGISYYDFERPALPDLEIGLEIKNNGTDYLIDVIVKNAGEAAAFNFYVDLFDNFNYSEKIFYEFLDAGERDIFSFVSDNLSIDELVAVVDFDNLIEERNESNNVVIYDGELSSDSFGDCLGIYNGGARSSVNPINVVSDIGGSYFASGKMWHSFNSLLNGGVTLLGSFSNESKVGRGMNCYFKLSSVILNGETLDVVSNSRKQAMVYSVEDANGSLEILREKYNFRLSDGMHVVSSGKYNVEDNVSSVKIKCMNGVAEKDCERACRGKRKAGKDECRGHGSCVGSLKDEYKDCKRNCADAYDVKSRYEMDGVVSLSIYDVLGECGYLGN